jgi:ribosomal protein S18 acetylase RimI-like enzyme
VTAIEIREISAVTPELARSLAELVRQLSSSAKLPTKDELQQIVLSPATVLLAAYRSESIVGMLTLVIFRIATGVRGIIEDVVVDETHRGQGIAGALVREALARARLSGARTVDLTSRPSRVAANRLYQKLGFQQRASNVYRFSFADSAH